MWEEAGWRGETISDDGGGSRRLAMVARRESEAGEERDWRETREVHARDRFVRGSSRGDGAGALLGVSVEALFGKMEVKDAPARADELCRQCARELEQFECAENKSRVRSKHGVGTARARGREGGEVRPGWLCVLRRASPRVGRRRRVHTKKDGRESNLFFLQSKKKIDFNRARVVGLVVRQSGGEGVVRVVGVRVSRDTGEHTKHPRVLDLHSISMNHHHTTTQFTPTERW